MPDRLSLTNSATQAILTPQYTTASQGAERLALVDESARQRLSAVNSASPTAEDRVAERAQQNEVSSHPGLMMEDSPNQAALALSRVHVGAANGGEPPPLGSA